MLAPLRRRTVMMCLLALTSLTPMVYAQGASSAMNVSTWHNDNNRTGWQQNETALTQANVSAPKSFGLLWQWFSPAVPIPGRVYAQPLAVADVAGQSCTTPSCPDLVFVATEQDVLYAFNAESSSQTPFWTVNLATAVNANYAAVKCADFGPPYTFLSCNAIAGTPPDRYVGVTGTPVIDTAANILYVVGAVENPGPPATASYYLFAVNITAANPQATVASVAIAGSVGGLTPGLCGTSSKGSTVFFDSNGEIQRSALLLLKGNVYMAFASGGTPGVPDTSEKENGWIFGYNYSGGTLTQQAIFNTTPFGTGGGIWGSGAGLAADSSGNIYAATGNGTFDLNTGGTDYGDSLLELVPPAITPGPLNVSGFYTPPDVFSFTPPPSQPQCGPGRCACDEDLDSGGVLLVPSNRYQYKGSYKNCRRAPCSVVIDADKESQIYVNVQGALPGYGNGQIQKVVTPCQGNPCVALDSQTAGFWASPAYWYDANGNSWLYYSPTTQTLTDSPLALYQYEISPNDPPIPVTANFSTTDLFCYRSPTPSVSSNQEASGTGIVWAIEAQYNAKNNNCLDYMGNAALHAYNASDVATELYNDRSTTMLGLPIPFAVPTIFNGYVYVGTQTEVDVFGLCSKMPGGSCGSQ